jgi:hypothetical protein
MKCRPAEYLFLQKLDSGAYKTTLESLWLLAGITGEALPAIMDLSIEQGCQ